ncbi:MAG: TonB-dependent receptor, partial [Nonlabens ulvanivorans]
MAQQATIQGVILDEFNEPVKDVNVSIQGTTIGTASNENGFYQLKVTANQKVVITFSAISYKGGQKELTLKNLQVYELNPVMVSSIEIIDTVVLNTTTREDLEGITTISAKVIRKIPGAQPGVENILKSLPGVSGSNELSTQYRARGGNFDENLVYINEIEVYRPFLIRSGQQEGLSFVNSDMVRSVDFSAGGFQSKYGDKLSSVLDIDYRRPTAFGAGIDASLLGVNAFVEGDAFAKAFTGILGVRYRDNSLLVNSRETEANAIPRFF